MKYMNQKAQTTNEQSGIQKEKKKKTSYAEGKEELHFLTFFFCILIYCVIMEPHWECSYKPFIVAKRLGLHLQPSEFQVAIKWWLGLDTSGGLICSLCPGSGVFDLLAIMHLPASMVVIVTTLAEPNPRTA